MQLEECNVKALIDVIAGKWKPLILRELKADPRRFGELRRAIPGVRHKVLTEQLRELEAEGIVSRTVQAGSVLHTEYQLTEYGGTLKPILQQMADWGLRHRQRKE